MTDKYDGIEKSARDAIAANPLYPANPIHPQDVLDLIDDYRIQAQVAIEQANAAGQAIEENEVFREAVRAALKNGTFERPNDIDPTVRMLRDALSQ